MRKLKNTNGSALLVVLALVLLIFAVGVITLDTANTDIELSYNQLHEDQAFYIAEAGAKQAWFTLNDSSSWRAGYSDHAFGDGAFSVSVRDSSSDSALQDTLIVTSTAVVDGSRAAIELTLAPIIIHPFTYALFAKNSVDMKNSFGTDSYNSDSGTYATTQTMQSGDVGSNGLITIANATIIGGNVSTALTGGASVHWGATVTGAVSDSLPEQEIPDVPDAEFDLARTTSAAPAGLSGSYTYDPSTKALQSTGPFTLASGVYYFSSIVLFNSAELIVAPGAHVTIYMTGNLEMKNSAAMNTAGVPDDLMIYSKGNFVLKNSGDIKGTLYSPNGDAQLMNSGQFYGSVVANNIVCDNGGRFHYDRNLSKKKRNSPDGFSIAAWKERY